MNVYHYTEFSSKFDKMYDNIFRNKKGYLEPRSLQPLHQEVADHKTFIKAIFGLLEPAPAKWTKSECFPTLWEHFIGTRGDLLLQVNINANDPNILVGDAGYIEGYLYRNHHNQMQLPNNYKIVDPETAFRKYQNSLIPIAQFSDVKPNYLLPEVQIRVPIDPARISISPYQPIFEHEIGTGHIPDETIYPIPQIKKYRELLKPWLNDFGAKSPELKQILDGARKVDYESRFPGRTR